MRQQRPNASTSLTRNQFAGLSEKAKCVNMGEIGDILPPPVANGLFPQLGNAFLEKYLLILSPELVASVR
jgi:hypothetical protein